MQSAPLRVTSYSVCESASRDRAVVASVLPSRIELEPSGRAIAWYGEAPLLWFASLDVLLMRFGLSRSDLTTPG